MKLNVKWRKSNRICSLKRTDVEFDTSIFLSKSMIRLDCSIRAYFALLKLLIMGNTTSNLCCTRDMI